jgi:hypothetical protein
MEAALKELQDEVVVVAHLEKRQSENLVELAEFRRRTDQSI